MSLATGKLSSLPLFWLRKLRYNWRRWCIGNFLKIAKWSVFLIRFKGTDLYAVSRLLLLRFVSASLGDSSTAGSVFISGRRKALSSILPIVSSSPEKYTSSLLRGLAVSLVGIRSNSLLSKIELLSVVSTSSSSSWTSSWSMSCGGTPLFASLSRLHSSLFNSHDLVLGLDLSSEMSCFNLTREKICEDDTAAKCLDAGEPFTCSMHGLNDLFSSMNGGISLDCTSFSPSTRERSSSSSFALLKHKSSPTWTLSSCLGATTHFSRVGLVRLIGKMYLLDIISAVNFFIPTLEESGFTSSSAFNATSLSDGQSHSNPFSVSSSWRSRSRMTSSSIGFFTCVSSEMTTEDITFAWVFTASHSSVVKSNPCGGLSILVTSHNSSSNDSSLVTDFIRTSPLGSETSIIVSFTISAESCTLAPLFSSGIQGHSHVFPSSESTSDTIRSSSLWMFSTLLISLQSAYSLSFLPPIFINLLRVPNNFVFVGGTSTLCDITFIWELDSASATLTTGS